MKTYHRVTEQIDTIQHGGDVIIQLKKSVADSAEEIAQVMDVFIGIKSGLTAVDQTFRQMSGSLEANSYAAETVAASTEEQLASLEEVTEIAGRLKVDSERLYEELNRFSV